MPFRIVFDARHLRDFGVGTYIRNLTRALAAIDSENHYTLVAHREDLRSLAGFPDNFDVAAYDRPDSQLWNNLSFPVFLRRFRADLFHLPLYNVPMWMPRPYVVTVHDLSALLFSPSAGWRRQVWLAQVRRGLRRAACVVAVSGATRRDVESEFGIRPERVRRIYNAPDPRFVQQQLPADARSAGPEVQERYRERILERYQIKYPFILYVGNIRPQKNIPRLVEAFAVLRGELADHPVYKDLRLIIIGDEISRYPAVRLAVMQSRVDNAVRFLGFVPIDTLRVFYEAATAFAFPSLYEGFGLPPLEAMACGTPVLTSNTSSLPETVGDAALTVDPADEEGLAEGLRFLAEDDVIWRHYRQRGLERAAQFTWRRTAEATLHTYRRAILG